MPPTQLICLRNVSGEKSVVASSTLTKWLRVLKGSCGAVCSYGRKWIWRDLQVDTAILLKITFLKTVSLFNGPTLFYKSCKRDIHLAYNTPWTLRVSHGPDMFFSWFSPASPNECENSILKKPWSLRLAFFPIQRSTIIPLNSIQIQ